MDYYHLLIETRALLFDYLREAQAQDGGQVKDALRILNHPEATPAIRAIAAGIIEREGIDEYLHRKLEGALRWLFRNLKAPKRKCIFLVSTNLRPISGHSPTFQMRISGSLMDYSSSSVGSSWGYSRVGF